ncbi:hypothetical protein NQU49_26600, partial [Escherichia coli]|uniref:rRNA adenine N-6-methyltransferase family protein n=1 Tax=Escherichia coli TaxID=562 RepID=UPI00274268F5
NFLVSDHVINKIVEAAEICLAKLDTKSMIEIGPGLGAITDLLTQLKCQYQAIELDFSLFNYWQNTGIKVTHGDALKLDWSGFDSDI